MGFTHNVYKRKFYLRETLAESLAFFLYLKFLHLLCQYSLPFSILLPQHYDFRSVLTTLKAAQQNWRTIFDLEKNLALIADEEQQTHDPSFWNDPKKAELHLKNIKKKKVWTDAWAVVNSGVEEIEVLLEFKDMGEDVDEEIDEKYTQTLQHLEDLEFKNMLSGEEDQLDAILEINAGAGGTESNDWASMLSRMYIMWGQNNGF